MQFKKFNFSKGLKTFKRLGLTNEQLTEVAKEYARLENVEEGKTIQQMFDIVRRHQNRDRLRKNAKKMVINAGHRLAAKLSGT